MNAGSRVVERDSRCEVRALMGLTWDNKSGPEGALTPESPGLTPHHSTQPRSEG